MSSYTKLLLGRVEELPITVYGLPPETGSVADWMPMSVPESDGRRYGFLFFYFSAFCENQIFKALRRKRASYHKTWRL